GGAAVQGARMAGARNIFAIEPIVEKHEVAKRLGATHVATSVAEAHGLINDVTWGRMCDKVICCVGVGKGEDIAPIMQLCAKLGRVVVTNIHPMSEGQVSLNLCDLT